MKGKIKLILGVLIVLALVSAVAAAYTLVINMQATVGEDPTVYAYEDESCTILIADPYTWGIVKDGDTKNVYIKNMGNVPVSVTIAISNQDGCIITSDISAFDLLVGLKQKVILTIETSAAGGSTITWKLTIDSVKKVT